jgi:hypothetical protein
MLKIYNKYYHVYKDQRENLHIMDKYFFTCHMLCHVICDIGNWSGFVFCIFAYVVLNFQLQTENGDEVCPKLFPLIS